MLLSGVKKGDALALVTSGGFWHPTTAVKVFVKKRNPASVVFEHDGEEHRANLDGRLTDSHSGRLEIWDDAKQAEREAAAAYFLAKRPVDVLREPALFAELEALRAAFVAQSVDLCKRIAASRGEGP